MAKDKGKKKSDEKSAKKSKGEDEFGKPSEAKGGGDGFRLEHDDNLGSLFLISPLREEDFKSEEYGDSKIIVADIVEINEKNPAKSIEHEEAYIFGGWTKGAVRSYIGKQRVLGRLGQSLEKSKSKKNPAWILEDATAKDADKAREYLASVDPFAQKGAKKDDDEKPKKDKGGKSEKAGKKKSKK